MEKGAEAFRSIGEVASLIGVAPHVLRYWETQFSLLKPVKRGDGRRYYRPDDVRLAAGLCEVLRDEGLTIRGARKLLARDRGAAVRARGAARLGEAMPVAPSAIAPVEPLIAAPPAPEPAPIIAPLDHAPDVGGAESHPPRARERHRRRPAADPLPLFPDLAAPKPPQDHAALIEIEPADWLAHLGAVAARLRAQDTPLPRAARKPAAHLLDQIAARL
ncbi:MAG: MerR family transcriptional regulator [Paracoccus sp. (in: a-proteobacteria)]|nr:MerR family transcriptional regulator [Paracoccus sp. (in: a-proteobacteria)]